LEARGQVWHKKDKKKGIHPKKPFDREADWGWSETKDEWIYGYGIHLSLIATPRVPVFPILAELTPANDKGIHILEENLSKISKKTSYIVADAEYDSQKLYHFSEKRLVSPIRETKNWKTKKKVMSKERRQRKEFFKSPLGQKLYRLRGTTVEQLFNVLKNIFEIEPSWFFGKTYAGLKILLEGFKAPKNVYDILVESVYMPKARLNEGLALTLTGAVTASIDSSDGLAWSLYEIAKASHVGFLIDNPPVASETKKFAEINSLDPLELAFYGGEEYELGLTVKPKLWSKAEEAVKKAGGSLIRIGKVTAEKQGILEVDGEKRVIEPRGWEHFRKH